MEKNIQCNALNVFRFTAYRENPLQLLVIYLRGKDKDHQLLIDVLIDQKFELQPISFDKWIDFQSEQNEWIKCFMLDDMNALKEFIKHFNK